MRFHKGTTEMHDIEMTHTTNEFFECWRAAAMHINGLGTDESFRWIKSELTPPYLEHLSFALGNQLYFIHVVDVDKEASGPGNPGGLKWIAKDCNGYCCTMPMKQSEDGWKPAYSGWGILNTVGSELLSPPDLMTDENIVMKDWEVHEFAVQVICQSLESSGKSIIAKSSAPDLDPSIWFEGPDGPEWIMIRSARYPSPDPERPDNWDKLVEHVSKLSSTGHFTGVVLANPKDPNLPLWRGEPLNARFSGME